MRAILQSEQQEVKSRNCMCDGDALTEEKKGE